MITYEYLYFNLFKFSGKALTALSFGQMSKSHKPNLERLLD